MSGLYISKPSYLKEKWKEQHSVIRDISQEVARLSEKEKKVSRECVAVSKLELCLAYRQ